jgi:large subunit ribosomal protein L25
VYGKVKENLNIQLNTRDFNKVYQKAGESTLIDLHLDDQTPIKVLIHDVHRDPVKQTALHVDLFAIDMNKKLTAEVQLKFIGESKAVKELGGVLVKNHDELEIECLPGDLVHEFEIDIAQLETFEKRITIGDLKAPKGVVFTEKPEEVVVFVEEPRSEKELDELNEQVDASVKDVEVEEHGKKEEEGEAGEGTATDATEKAPQQKVSDAKK